MTTGSLARQWYELDKRYTLNNHYGLKRHNQVRFRPRGGRLLLTAPHAVHHYRGRGRPDKPSDACTGGLCDLLGKELGVSSLTAASLFDPWNTWPERSDDFKQHITQAAAAGNIIIDVHGMSDDHGTDICIGLGPDPDDRTRDIARIIHEALPMLKVSINQPFAARLPHTVTAYVQSIQGTALQIELARRLRNPAGDPATAERNLCLLIRAFRKVMDSN